MKKVKLMILIGLSLFILVSCSKDEPDNQMKQCTITFDVQGGSAIASITVEEGQTIVLDDYKTEKKDFSFEGWSLTKEGDLLTGTFKVEQHVTLYARFLKDSKLFTITFKDENGMILVTKQVKEGEAPSHTYQPVSTASTEHTFLGWRESTDTKILENLPSVTKDTTYVAEVSSKTKEYSIHFNTNNGSYVESINAPYGTEVKQPVSPIKIGYQFEGWTYDDNYKEPVTWPITMSKEMTLFAHFTEKFYHITFEDENGTVLVTKQVKEGEVPSHAYQPVSTVSTEYTFLGWRESTDTKILENLPPVTKDVTYVAEVSSKTKEYNIHFNFQGGSYVASIKVPYGTEVPQPVNPKMEGHTFVAWIYNKRAETGLWRLLKK